MMLSGLLENNLLRGGRPSASAGTAADAATAETPGGVLAGFMELRGRPIVRGCGVLWYTTPGKFLMSLPHQRMLDPDPAELHRMICEAGVCGVRFPSSRWSGLESGLYLLRKRRYDIGSIHVKHRPRVRRGLQCFQVRPAEKWQLLEQGRELNVSTMARQGRYDPEVGEATRWAALVEAAFACPGISFPAVFRGARLAAYMVTCREQNWLHILHQMSRCDDLPDFPNHVLTYAVTSEAAADDTLENVSYGYVPLFAADGLHEYKLRFGYEMIPHRSVIQLHPLLDRLLNCRPTRGLVNAARRLRAQDQQLETIGTVLEGARVSGPPPSC
jgi:hypothetical protein